MFKARLVQRSQRRVSGHRGSSADADVATGGAGCSRCCHGGEAHIDGGGGMPGSMTHSLSYQYVAKSSWKRQRAVVGGRRVPYSNAQRQHQRQRRRTYLDHNGLSPIDEEPANVCEACHSNTFSSLDLTKHVTFIQTRCNVKLHRRWAPKHVDVAIC